MVISWILNSISKEISASIIYVYSAREIWIDLRDRFQQSNGEEQGENEAEMRRKGAAQWPSFTKPAFENFKNSKFAKHDYPFPH